MMVLYLLIIGAAAGFLATRWGILRLVLAALSVGVGFVGALVGSVVLIWVCQTYMARR